MVQVRVEREEPGARDAVTEGRRHDDSRRDGGHLQRFDGRGGEVRTPMTQTTFTIAALFVGFTIAALIVLSAITMGAITGT